MINTPNAKNLKIHVYADGANKDAILKRAQEGFVKGFTTNPSLMAKAGVKDYAGFAKSLLSELKTHPISFEVFSDDFEQMEKEAMIINSWNTFGGNNVYVKIPVINSENKSSAPLIRRLLDKKLKLNITAIFTTGQLDALRAVLKPEDDVLVSLFAGRLADNGWDPLPLVRKAVADFKPFPKAQILWASTREVYNVYQAEELGCHIITAPDDVISKLMTVGAKSPEDLSIDTVKTFLKDSKSAGLSL
jgi:transaldolase